MTSKTEIDAPASSDMPWLGLSRLTASTKEEEEVGVKRSKASLSFRLALGLLRRPVPAAAGLTSPNSHPDLDLGCRAISLSPHAETGRRRVPR